MKIGPKYKICKRLGSGIFEKCQTQKFQLSVSRAKKVINRRRSMSDYGKQLIEKQKIRFSYGITEKQFRNYIDAANATQDTISTIHKLLETRLDNVIYMAGFAKTRRMARQLVTHGHILVNGKRVKIPSYRVSIDDSIEVRKASKNKAVFENIDKNINVPKWLDVDIKKFTISIKSYPVYDGGATLFDYQSVFEFYSR